MDHTQLTHDQAQAMGDCLGPALGYLSRLQRCIERNGFPIDEKLLTLVCEAKAKVRDLSVELCGVSTGDGE